MTIAGRTGKPAHSPAWPYELHRHRSGHGHYESFCSGPPVILPHGGIGSWGRWHRAWEFLAWQHRCLWMCWYRPVARDWAVAWPLDQPGRDVIARPRGYRPLRGGPPQARIETKPKAGQFPMPDEPGEVSRLLGDFLARKAGDRWPELELNDEWRPVR